MKIRVDAANYRAYCSNTLKGFVDLTIPGAGLVIHECSWHEKEGREWVAFPGKPMLDKTGKAMLDGKTGKPRYANLIELNSQEAREAFREAAIGAIHRLLGAGSDAKRGAAGRVDAGGHDVNPLN